MKIRLEETTMIIVPETDFESEYLKRYQVEGVNGFLKTGIDLTHVIGLKIFPGESVEQDGCTCRWDIQKGFVRDEECPVHRKFD